MGVMRGGFARSVKRTWLWGTNVLMLPSTGRTLSESLWRGLRSLSHSIAQRLWPCEVAVSKTTTKRGSWRVSLGCFRICSLLRGWLVTSEQHARYKNRSLFGGKQ